LKILITFSLLLLVLVSYGQEEVVPFTGRAYWLELQDPNYRSIILKQREGIQLTPEENKYLNFYDNRLEDYYNQLSDKEKTIFRNFKSQWDEEDELSKNEDPNDVLETNARGVLPGKKYRLYNGIYGFIYGAALIPILGLEENALGYSLPLLLAGGSLLLPVINPKKYEDLSFSSVLLSRQGKFYGLIDGAALGLLAFGSDSEESAKGVLSFAIAASIAMGEIGLQLGKKKDWSDGKISGYGHYSTVSLLFGTGLYASFAGDFNARSFGATLLASHAAGYYLSNKLYKKYNYTRGDILASGSFTFFSTILGLGLVEQVVSNDNQKYILLPTLSLLAGSILSHSLTRNKNLTPAEGWKVSYAAGAGSLLGLGAALLISPEEPTLYLLLPATGGLIGWGAMLKSVSRSKSARGNGNATLSYSFQPENYFLNKQTPFELLSPDDPARAVVSLTFTY